MSFPAADRPGFVERLRDFFDADLTKLFLSTLIILSVMPRLEAYSPLFFVIFAVEFGLRFIVLRDRFRRGELDRLEIALLILDFIAVLSFLPLEQLLKTRFLRLLRLSRMLMLLGYWKPVVKEIWIILTKRERRYQLTFVASAVVLLTFSSAILLYHLESFGIDFNEDGLVSSGERTASSFWTLVWWSFRQLQDPGNLLRDPTHSLTFIFSFLLTMCGIFIIAFLIGIGTTVVDELVQVGRERRLGLRDHSVIANLGPHSKVLVEELVAYYAKSFRSPRLVTMGQAANRYEFMYEDHLRAVRYRRGTPNLRHDLIRVDADRARRVILLGHSDRQESDAEVISQLLSVREVNPHCLVLAELSNCNNVHAALAAGGNTVPILSRHFVVMLMAQIITSPGSERIYGELLSSRGHEIYTCVFGSGALADQPPPAGPLAPFAELLTYCHRQHGVTLLGQLVEASSPLRLLDPIFEPKPSTAAPPPAGYPRGLFGVATNFEQMRTCALDASRAATPATPKQEPPLIPHLVASPLRRSLRGLLICGFHDGLVELCEQLLLLCGDLQLHLMVPAPAEQRSIIEQLLARNQASTIGGTLPGARVRYSRRSDCQVDYQTNGERASHGTIFVMTGDWSDERDLLDRTEGRFRLSDIETIVYTYVTTEADPDARTALGLLKLFRLRSHNPDLLHKHLRVVCVVRERNKADLFARRFGSQQSRNPAELAVTIIPVERMRSAFLAQAVFVPGIASIYEELLGDAGYGLHRLRVDQPASPGMFLDFGDLLDGLFRRSELIALAVELEDESERRIVVTPSSNHPDYRFSASSLRSVYAVGRASADVVDTQPGEHRIPRKPRHSPRHDSRDMQPLKSVGQ